MSLDILPSTVYNPVSSRRASIPQNINTVMEGAQEQIALPTAQRSVTISPFSDNFPTPRAMIGFKVSPVSDIAEESPKEHLATERDSLYDVTDNEEEAKIKTEKKLRRSSARAGRRRSTTVTNHKQYP